VQRVVWVRADLGKKKKKIYARVIAPHTFCAKSSLGSRGSGEKEKKNYARVIAPHTFCAKSSLGSRGSGEKKIHIF